MKKVFSEVVCFGSLEGCEGRLIPWSIVFSPFMPSNGDVTISRHSESSPL